MSNSVFPSFTGLSWPVKRSPRFHTKVMAAVSGMETRAAFMAYPLYKIDLTFDYLSLNDWQTLGGFFKARKGKFDSFLFDDLEDNTATAQLVGTGNGSTTSFQLVRSVGGFTEPVENPKSTGLNVYISGALQSSGYVIGPTGILTFTAAPSVAVSVTWTGGYYWRVRFDQDDAEFSQTVKNIFDLKKLILFGSTGNKV